MRSLILRGIQYTYCRRRAFSLLELVLATAIFSIATLSIAQCFIAALQASHDNATLMRIRLSMQNLLAEARVAALRPERTMLNTDLLGVNFQREVRRFPVQNANGQTLSGLLAVRITAIWDSASGPSTEVAEIYIPEAQNVNSSTP